jgi:signal transduction histidine kinase
MSQANFFDIGNKLDLKRLLKVPWLVPVLYVMSALAFVSDICRDNLLAYGILYAPLIATAVYHERGAGLWYLTVTACILVILGALFPVVDGDLPDMIGNRVLSILAILTTAAFVHHARATQERLAAQTHRAEAAERIKSEVLTNLSQELRMPMHVLLGAVSLMITNCRPDQREALSRLRSGGKQLLETINNLIDLTQIDEHRLTRQPIDVATIARDAAAGARASASERQVTVAVDGLSTATALGDAWATRRVLDNLLANAIQLSPPGGSVSLSVDRAADTVDASVSDSGTGIPAELVQHFQDDALDLYGGALAASGGTGLALSNRLARNMQGRLTVREQSVAGRSDQNAPASGIGQADSPGSGGTISLSLPAG